MRQGVRDKRVKGKRIIKSQQHTTRHPSGADSAAYAPSFLQAYPGTPQKLPKVAALLWETA